MGMTFFTVDGHDGGSSGFCVEEFEVRASLGDFNKSSGFELFDDLLGRRRGDLGAIAIPL